MAQTFLYTREDDLDWREFRDVLVRSGLDARRPVNDEKRLESMCSEADVIVCCRTQEGLLAGVARSISDFSFCTYLSDLAVDETFQKQGIGKKLIDETHVHAGLQTTLILLSAPAARTYYPHIGMEQHDSCWIISRKR